MKNIFNLIRVKHWIKNVLIFLPAFFGGVIKDTANIKILVFVFLYFSIAASVVYVINDLIDRKKDMLHPQKKLRALASGKITKNNAILLLTFMLLLLIYASFYLPVKVVFVTVVYLLLNLAYCLHLKTIPILEFFIVALGFVFRILIGGFGVEVEPSKWIIMLSFFLALYIILSKRRGEILNKDAINTREVLKSYSEAYLTQSMIIIASISVLAYIMYTVEPSTIQRFSTDKTYITSIFVAFGILRHLQQTFVHNNTESPVKYFFKDKLMLIVVFLWLFLQYFLIYIL